jgi:hypothetical protein
MRFRTIFIPIMFIASILITINIVKLNMKCEERVVYKYLPSDYKDNPNDPIPVSKIFEKMFERPSTWIERVIEPDRNEMKKYNDFITQG